LKSKQTSSDGYALASVRTIHHIPASRVQRKFSSFCPGGATADPYRARNTPQATWLALRDGRLRVMLPSSRYGAFVALCCRRGGAPPIGWRADFGVAWFREKYRLSFGLNQT
jgi:hypothetical protein